MVNKESQASNWDNQELHSECVMVAIICCLELHVDQVDCGISTSNVDHLMRSRGWKAFMLFILQSYANCSHIEKV